MNSNTKAAIAVGVAVLLVGTVSFASGAPFTERPASSDLPMISTDRPVEAVGQTVSPTPPAVTSPSEEPSWGAEPAESEQGSATSDDDTHEVVEPDLRDEGPESDDVESDGVDDADDPEADDAEFSDGDESAPESTPASDETE